MKKGKILHVFNLCGVPCVLSKLMIAEGYKSKVYGRKDQDGRKYHEFYPDVFTAKGGGKKWYLINLIYQLFRYRPNLVQVHYNRRFLKIVSKFKKILGFKLVYHAHGGDLRGKPLRESEIDLCDLIIVSTPDLLNDFLVHTDKMIYMPNPIDPSFIQLGNRAEDSITKGKVLYPRARPIDRMSEVRKYVESNPEMFDELVIVDRIDGEGIFYTDMMNLLPTCEFVLDWKGATEFEHSPIKNGETQAQTKGYMSNVSYEALAMGVSVIFEDLSSLVPEEMNFEEINQNWVDFYNQFFSKMLMERGS